MRVRVLRVLLAGLGVLVGGYGAFLLLSRQDGDQLLNAAVWLASGVVLHDFVLAPLVLGLVVLAARIVPAVGKVPAAVALVVLGTATVLAVPVLGRFGERPDNPTLLDRDYTAGWLALAGVVLLATVVATLLRSRQEKR